MKVETKYEIGQEVWFMMNNTTTCRKVFKIEINIEGGFTRPAIGYHLENSDIVVWEDKPIYTTKEELLKSL